MMSRMRAGDRLRVYIGPRRKRKNKVTRNAKGKAGGYYPRWPYRYRLPGQPWVHGTGGFTEASTRQLVDGLMQQHMLRLRMSGRGGDEVSDLPVDKHIEDYLRWARHEGGRGGLPWSADHLAHRRAQLREWVRVLGIQTLADISYDAFAAENTTRLESGVAPNTVNHHAWALVAFVKWCHQRARIATNRLVHFTSLDSRPRRERGAFGAAEFRALLAAAPPSRRLLYRMALCTGLRRTALASLKVGDVDWEAGLVTLHWGAAKNRKTVVKPLPGGLLEDLRSYCANKSVHDSLLDFSPRQAARAIHRDMRQAGIHIEKDGRRRDFHSLKASLGTMLDDVGTLPELTQRALDHASFRQTQAYIKRDLAPLRDAVEELEQRLGLGDEAHTSGDTSLEMPTGPREETGGSGSSHSDTFPPLLLSSPPSSPSGPTGNLSVSGSSNAPRIERTSLHPRMGTCP